MTAGTGLTGQYLAKWEAIMETALVTRHHMEGSKSKRSDGKKLADFADLVLDTGAPLGDSMIWINNLETPVAPGSTVGGVMVVNSIKAELAALLTAAGQPPRVLTAPAIVGTEKATALFEAAYDEQAHRMAEVYRHTGRNLNT